MRITGDWTRKAASLLGVYDKTVDLRNIKLPTLRIDGPYGAPAEDMHDFSVAVLVGAGIGVTPAASLLKSIWYKYFRNSDMKLKKLYFFWQNRDKESFAWFQSLLASLEDTVPKSFLEIHTYLTGQLGVDEIENIMLNKDDDCDPITELQTQTHFGRPKWANVMASIRANILKSYPNENRIVVPIFFCGPKPLAKIVGEEAAKCSTPQVQCVIRKENF